MEESPRLPKLNINFPVLIDDVTDRFLKDLKPGVDIKITEDARKWLIEEGAKRKDEADLLLSDGKITLDFVENELKQLLLVALGLAMANRSDITEQHIQRASRWWCLWLFWC
jgi:hypothetical protein